MEAKKKNQHYVPQKYLDSFCVDGQLFCLRNKKLFKTAPRNVASENYFYKMRKLTDQEIKFIKAFNSQIKDETLRRYAERLSDTLIAFTKYAREFEKMKPILCWCSNNSTDDKLNGETKTFLKKLEEEQSVTWNNWLEDLLEFKEENAEVVFAKLRDNDLTPLLDDIDGINELSVKEYLYLQFFRTKKVSTLFAESMAETQKTLNNPEYNDIDYNVVHMACLLSYAFNAACISKGKIHVLKNNTMVPFITSDQPVINLSAQCKNAQGQTITDDMFLSLTPCVAIIFTDKKICEFVFDKDNVSASEVQDFNDQINANMATALYANNEISLQKYK